MATESGYFLLDDVIEVLEFLDPWNDLFWRPKTHCDTHALKMGLQVQKDILFFLLVWGNRLPLACT